MVCKCDNKNIGKPKWEDDGKQYIYILLVRYPDRISTISRFLTMCKYSHASIGVSDSGGTFYSYATNGFRKELPIKHPTFRAKEVLCKLYSIEVSDEICGVAKDILADHEQQSHKYKYNFFGVLLCLLRLVLPRKNRYFCSQFVSDMLKQMGVVPLAKHTALYLPDDFTKMKELHLRFSGYLSELVGRPATRRLLTA